MYTDILNHIGSHCQALDRKPPVLVAVSKTQPNEAVEEVLKQGHRIFGENRVQEAAGKWPDFRAQYGAVELHLLGPLQTNKVKQALDLFDVLHSLDRIKLARKIADEAQSRGKCPDLFVQVNIGKEPQKAGVSIEDLPSFLDECRLMSLPIIGLMCIPPAVADPRQYFQQLRELASVHGIDGLSMGMSGDYLVAIEEGATHIRVGSAIFGARDYS